MTTKTTNYRALARKRARALATILLTSRPDFSVDDAPSDSGLDYIVTIGDCPRPGIRQFGVIVDSVVSANTDDEVKRAIALTVRSIPSEPYRESYTRLETYPLPVVLLFYTAVEDTAWFKWVFKPVGINLERSRTKEYEVLDESILERIAEAVIDRAESLFPDQASFASAISKNGRR